MCISGVYSAMDKLCVLLRKSKNLNLSQPRGLIITTVLQYSIANNDYPEVHHRFYKMELNLGGKSTIPKCITKTRNPYVSIVNHRRLI